MASYLPQLLYFLFLMPTGMAQFEKCARTYPYPTDIQSERELMDIAREKTLAG